MKIKFNQNYDNLIVTLNLIVIFNFIILILIKLINCLFLKLYLGFFLLNLLFKKK